jgi:predicted MFS family arabinose efflux permease
LIEFVVIGGGIDTVSVFVNAIATAEGWSRSSLSAAISVGIVSAALATPVVGLLVDRFGVRAPMALGLGLLAAGFGILVSMTQPWHFSAANVLLGSGFAGCGVLPITVAVAMRVPDRTAFALGLVATGSSAGALVLAPTLQLLVDAYGWRGAYMAIGTAVVLVPVPLILFALPRGRLQRKQGDGSHAALPKIEFGREIRRPGVFLLTALLILPAIVSFGLQIHLVPFLADVGHPRTLAAGALGAAIGLSAIGKIAGGWAGDRLGVLPTFRIALLLQLAAVALLPLVGSPFVLGVFVVLHGIAVGTEIAVTPVIALGILGSARFATLFGLLQLVSTFAIGLAPIVPGVIFDTTGGYGGAIGFWVATMGLGLFAALRLRMPAQPA